MDKDLAEGTRIFQTDNLYKLIRECYNESNKEYLQKQF